MLAKQNLVIKEDNKMNKIDFIEKIQTEIQNGSTGTRVLVLDLIFDLKEIREIIKSKVNQGKEGPMSVEITLEDNVQVNINFETTEINSENTLYFYEIS